MQYVVKNSFPTFHFNFFPVNRASVSDEHGYRFHQEIPELEKRYQGRWEPAMHADYYWGLRRNTATTDYKRKPFKIKYVFH